MKSISYKLIEFTTIPITELFPNDLTWFFALQHRSDTGQQFAVSEAQHFAHILNLNSVTIIVNQIVVVFLLTTSLYGRKRSLSKTCFYHIKLFALKTFLIRLIYSTVIRRLNVTNRTGSLGA